MWIADLDGKKRKGEGEIRRLRDSSVRLRENSEKLRVKKNPRQTNFNNDILKIPKYEADTQDMEAEKLKSQGWF
jgi:hypothetical protein